MNNKIKILGITLVAVLALAALGAGVAFAQTLKPKQRLWLDDGRARRYDERQCSKWRWLGVDELHAPVDDCQRWNAHLCLECPGREA